MVTEYWDEEISLGAKIQDGNFLELRQWWHRLVSNNILATGPVDKNIVCQGKLFHNHLGFSWFQTNKVFKSCLKFSCNSSIGDLRFCPGVTYFSSIVSKTSYRHLRRSMRITLLGQSFCASQRLFGQFYKWPCHWLTIAPCNLRGLWPLRLFHKWEHHSNHKIHPSIKSEMEHYV